MPASSVQKPACSEASASASEQRAPDPAPCEARVDVDAHGPDAAVDRARRDGGQRRPAEHLALAAVGHHRRIARARGGPALPIGRVRLEGGVSAGDPGLVDAGRGGPVRGARAAPGRSDPGRAPAARAYCSSGCSPSGGRLALGELLLAGAFGADADGRLLLLGLDDRQAHLAARRPRAPGRRRRSRPA